MQANTESTRTALNPLDLVERLLSNRELGASSYRRCLCVLPDAKSMDEVNQIYASQGNVFAPLFMTLHGFAKKFESQGLGETDNNIRKLQLIDWVLGNEASGFSIQQVTELSELYQDFWSDVDRAEGWLRDFQGSDDKLVASWAGLLRDFSTLRPLDQRLEEADLCWLNRFESVYVIWPTSISAEALARRLQKILPTKIWQANLLTENQTIEAQDIWPQSLLDKAKLYRAPDGMTEVKGALDYIETCIKQGIPAWQIGVLGVSDLAYESWLRYWLKREDYSFTVEFAPSALKDHAVGQLLNNMFLIGGLDCPRSVWVDLLSSAPLRKFFESESKSKLSRTQVLTWLGTGFDIKGSESLRVQAAQLKAGNSGQQQVAAVLAEYCEFIATVFEPWIEKLSKEASISLEAWFRDFSDVVSGFLPHCSEQSSILQNSIIVIEELSKKHTKVKMRPKEFFKIIEVVILQTPIVEKAADDNAHTLKLLSLADALNFPISVFVFIGSFEGNLPKSLPQETIVPRSLRSSLGLTDFETLETMQQKQFRLALARARSCWFSFTEEHLGQPKVPSRYLTLLPDGTDIKDLVPLTSGEHAGLGESAEPELFGKWMGERRALFGSFTAYSAKNFIRCPYRYLLDKLSVSSSYYEQSKGAMIEGEMLHAILEAFYTGFLNGDELVQRLRVKDLQKVDAKSALLHRFKVLTEAALREHPDSELLFLQLVGHSWPRFVEFILQLFQHSADYFWMKEVTLDTPLAFGGHSIEFRGRLDSLDGNCSFQLLLDYKRNTLPAKNEIKQATQPQMLLYAMALKEKGMIQDYSKLALGYWSILKGEPLFCAAGGGAQQYLKELGLISSRGIELIEDCIQKLETLSNWRLTEILKEGRNFEKDDFECDLCDKSGLCRKGDPQNSGVESRLKVKVEQNTGS